MESWLDELFASQLRIVRVRIALHFPRAFAKRPVSFLFEAVPRFSLSFSPFHRAYVTRRVRDPAQSMISNVPSESLALCTLHQTPCEYTCIMYTERGCSHGVARILAEWQTRRAEKIATRNCCACIFATPG